MTSFYLLSLSTRGRWMIKKVQIPVYVLNDPYEENCNDVWDLHSQVQRWIKTCTHNLKFLMTTLSDQNQNYFFLLQYSRYTTIPCLPVLVLGDVVRKRIPYFTLFKLCQKLPLCRAVQCTVVAIKMYPY